MLSSMGDDQLVKQAQEILEYFVNHPGASDSLEGIARWRLLQRRVSRTVEGVQRALELLVKMDLLQQQSTAAFGKRYSLNATKMDECRTWLGDEKLGKDESEGGALNQSSQ